MAGINPYQAPINYSIDVQGPFEAALGGFKLGAAGAEVQAKQAEAQAKETARKNAMDAQAKVQALLADKNATASDLTQASFLLPKDQADNVLKIAGEMTTVQNQNTLSQAGQVYSALKAGQPEIAKQLLQDQIDAHRNSGNEPKAKATETYLKLIGVNPTGAQNTIGIMMAMMPGGKEILENVDKTLSTGRLEAQAPEAQRKAVADADAAIADAKTKQATADNAAEKAKADAALATANAAKEAVVARFAERSAQAELDKSAAVIRKTDADIIINRENARIAALNAAQAKETNVLRRDELRQKIDDAKEKRDTADRDQRATLASQSADIDNFINTAEQIKQTPISIIKSATGPIASRLPTTNQDVANFEALIETLGSQAFIAQIPKIKGTGTLTEKEGDKLQSSLQNLSLKQSPDQLIANVTEAVRLMGIARVNIAARAGLFAPPSDVPAKQEVFVPLPDGTRIKFPNQAAADAYKKAAGIK